MKPVVTLSVEEKTLEKMREYYSIYFRQKEGEYIDFNAVVNDVVITAYLSKKANHKVVFIGDEALSEAKLWDENAAINVKEEEPKKSWIYFGDQIGSDEVGVGDFLLPMIVVAAFVSASDVHELIELGIKDSKQLTDETILSLGPIITKRLKFSKLTITNEKYNEQIAKGENINSLKAKMHNRALNNLHEQYPDVINIFIDQFVNKKKYYEYLQSGQDSILRGVTFKTKGESLFPCVALASVIARYA
ncbi:MAG TPA: ribonuclease HIII, partial [Bacilli bacterium]|nr:ribonuclease HIII [Bacilli bacterium]